MIRDIIDLIISVFTIILFFVVIYMILLKLTGHSPTLDQITVALSVGTVILVVKIFYNTGKFSEFMDNAKENTREIKLDIKELNRKLEKTNKDITIIKTKLLN